MIQEQLHAIFALLPHNNMPFVKSVKSGLDFMAGRISFGCHFYIKQFMQKFQNYKQIPITDLSPP